MKYLSSVICSLLIIQAITGIALSQEKPVYIYKKPGDRPGSCRPELPPNGTVDPVPPLGEDDEKCLKAGKIKEIISNFVNRVEATYTKKYPPPEGFIEWLKERDRLRSTFWLALSPYYDDIAKAMEVLNKLRQADPKAVERFYHLAVAFAVVWDSPDAVISSRYSCIWGVEPGQFEALPSYLDTFKYYTHSRNQSKFVFKLDQLPWPILVHLVDMDLTTAEIEWGLKKYKGMRKRIGEAYKDLTYDHDKVEDKKPRLGKRKYALPNLFKSGGICGDQAHYATRLGKMFGVPAMKVYGENRYGGAHAWFGCMTLKKTQPVLVFTGRYFFDHYYTGHLFDPQTRTNILDREVALMYDGATLNYHKYIDSLALARMARSLFKDQPEVSIDLAINALKRNWFCAPAWFLVMQHAENKTMDSSRGIKYLNNMFKFLREHPDMTLIGLITFIDCIPRDEHRKRDALYRRADDIYRTAKRPDLQIRLAIQHGDELCLRKDEARAIKLYMDKALEHAQEGALVLPLVAEADRLFRKLKLTGKAISQYEKIIKYIPEKRGEKVSESFQEMAELLVAMYETNGLKEQARKLRNKAELNK